MLNIQFQPEGPPSVQGRKVDPVLAAEIAGVVAALTQRPDQWAIVYEGVPRNTSSNRAAQLKAEGLEVATRTQPDKTVNVWAKYVPPSE